MNFKGAKDYILNRLENELTSSLSYHSVEHTLDVAEAACHFAYLENLKGDDLVFLETAALYHDSGILTQYKDHESVSVSLVRETLPLFEYSMEEIEEVSRLIMITRLPQKAVSLPEQILCDADLDYLGRDDFFVHSFQLQLEWRNLGILETNLLDWLKIQVHFLSEHRYFTRSANSLRNEKKLFHLEQIKNLINIHSPE